MREDELTVSLDNRQQMLWRVFRPVGIKARHELRRVSNGVACFGIRGVLFEVAEDRENLLKSDCRIVAASFAETRTIAGEIRSFLADRLRRGACAGMPRGEVFQRRESCRGRTAG